MKKEEDFYTIFNLKTKNKKDSFIEFLKGFY
jgi:hypothetical protein